MNNNYFILLRKQLKESFSYFKKGKKSFDLIGFITSLLLVFIVAFVFVYLYAIFVETYTKISFGGDEVINRQYEILTISYTALLIFNIISGVKNIEASIASSEDFEILLVLPIKSQTIFFSKLTGILIKQIFTSILIILPINLVFGLITTQSTYYILISILMCLIIPIISVIISSFFAIPYHYLAKYLKSKYTLLTIISFLGIALFFYFYSKVLNLFEQLLQTGAIKFVFTTRTMLRIKSLTKYLYPGNILSQILLKQNLFINFLKLISLILIFGSLAYILIKRMFTRVTQGKMENGNYLFKKKDNYRELPTFISLMKKEFVNIIRTPNYAFQYFAIALSLPLMVYTTISLTSSLVSTAIGINCNFELTFFVLLMFMVLTNTFCATNISRDGKMFMMMKTMPINFKQTIYSKVIFSSLVSIISILITVVLLISTKYLLWSEGIIIFIITALISFSEIFFATRKDLNRPNFPVNQRNEILESNNTVSLMIFLGLLSSLIIGALTLFSKIITTFNPEARFDYAFSIIIVSLIAIALFFLSLIYLRSGLKKRYYQMEE